MLTVVLHDTWDLRVFDQLPLQCFSNIYLTNGTDVQTALFPSFTHFYHVIVELILFSPEI